MNRLSVRKKDWESVIGFRPPKFTGVNYGFTMLMGALLCAAFYVILYQFHSRGIQSVDMFFSG